MTNQLDNFVENLEDKDEFRRCLLALKQEQEEALFKLEQEYLKLVRERRTALLSYLKSSSTTKRALNDNFKGMHVEVQTELDSFLAIRVYEGWQCSQLHRQRQCLLELGVSAALLQADCTPQYMRELMSFLLYKSI